MEWELTKVVLGPSEQQTEQTNALSRQRWQPYAVTGTRAAGIPLGSGARAATRAWLTNPGQRVVTCRPTLKLTAAARVLFPQPARLAATMQARR